MLLVAKIDARLGEIVRRHLEVDLVANADADEIFPHLAGNVGEDFVAVGEGNAKHRARQHLGHRTGQFNWFFFRHVNWFFRVNPVDCKR